MISNLADLLFSGDKNLAGELLREATFVGEGTGCYHNFEVRVDAVAILKPIAAARLAREDYLLYEELLNHLNPEGFQFWLHSLEAGDIYVEVFWYWDSDGVLLYYISHDGKERLVENTDCKKSHWEDIGSENIFFMFWRSHEIP